MITGAQRLTEVGGEQHCHLGPIWDNAEGPFQLHMIG